MSTTFCFSALFWSFPPKTPPHLGIENSHKGVPHDNKPSCSQRRNKRTTMAKRKKNVVVTSFRPVTSSSSHTRCRQLGNPFAHHSQISEGVCKGNHLSRRNPKDPAVLKSRKKLYTPPPPPPISGQKAFSGEGGGCIF